MVEFWGSLHFDISWTGGGTNSTRLSNWLDPNNSGATTTNTTNISSLIPAEPTLTVNGSPTNDYICTGSSTYTITGLPANASVCWSLSNSYASIPNPSCSSSVVVTVQSAGFVTLTATVTLCDGQIRTVDKKIMIGAAVEGYYIINSNYHQPIQRPLYNSNSPIWLPANQSFSVYAQITSSVQSPSWTKNASSYNFNWSQSGVTLNFSGTSGSTAYTQRNGIFDFTAQTSCGTYNGTFTWPVIVQGWGFRLLVTPNPANSFLLVSIENETLDFKRLRNEGPIIMTLYDLNSTLAIKRWNFNNNQSKFNLNLNGVKSGHYILVVKKDKFQQSKQIIIEK